MIDELLDCELAYINTNHPAFIGGAAALQSVSRAGGGSSSGNVRRAPDGARYISSSAALRNSKPENSWFGGLFGSGGGGVGDSAQSGSGYQQQSQTAGRSGSDSAPSATERARQNSMAEREAQQVDLLRNILAVCA